MSEMYDENQVFDWDDEIEDDGEGGSFVTLEPGKYDFTVTGLERAFHEHKEGGKAPSCPKAVIKIRISTKDGDCYITENFLLYKKMEWKISQFFRCVGLKEYGEKVNMKKWDEVMGVSGRVEVTKDKGTNDGVFFNHVKAWLDPTSKGKTEEDDEWS